MSCSINSVGVHYIFDIYDCNRKKIEYQKNVKELLNKIIDILQLSKVNEAYQQFTPVGVTGFILLRESHVSIHTWPEHSFAALDVFSCKNDLDTDGVKVLIEAELETGSVEIHSIRRGDTLFVDEALSGNRVNRG